MSVLHWHGYYFPTGYGGLEHFMTNLAEKWQVCKERFVVSSNQKYVLSSSKTAVGKDLLGLLKVSMCIFLLFLQEICQPD